MNEMSKESAQQLADEWPRDIDGFPHRVAARVVVLDREGRIFLILGHDFDDDKHQWWFTPGGGLEAGETPREGAVRELSEETGLVVDPNRLVGPVLIRHATFHFAREVRKQDEEFYLLHVSDEEREQLDHMQGTALTPLEQQLLDEYRWFFPGQIEQHQSVTPFYPQGLAAMLRSWQNWDGGVIEVTET